jgi:hypothetical protein
MSYKLRRALAATIVPRDSDPRRQQPVVIRWKGMIAQLYIGDEMWGAIEWSDKRRAWCIEDAEGRCLRHKSHIHGAEAAKDEAVDLAKAMIADGRMPSPQEAGKSYAEEVMQKRAKRAQQPAQITRDQRRATARRLFSAKMEADLRDEEELPLWEVLAQAFDFTDPDIWRSNSFAVMRPRLIISIKRTIAELEHMGSWLSDESEAKRLTYAKQVLSLLEVEPERLPAKGASLP